MVKRKIVVWPLSFKHSVGSTFSPVDRATDSHITFQEVLLKPEIRIYVMQSFVIFVI